MLHHPRLLLLPHLEERLNNTKRVLLTLRVFEEVGRCSLHMCGQSLYRKLSRLETLLVAAVDQNL